MSSSAKRAWDQDKTETKN